MVISFTPQDDVLIKAKTANILLNSVAKIDTYTVPGAGEYDVKGIQCEAEYLPDGLVYFFRAEDILITYMTSVDQKATKMEDSADTNILVLSLCSDNTADQVKVLVKALEPSFLLLTGPYNPTIITDLNLTTEKTSTLKVTASSLPAEGTTLIVRE